MKKILTSIILCTLIFSLSACGVAKKCDLCDERGANKTLTAFGETYDLCGSCYSEFSFLEEDYSYDYDDYDYDYDYDDYDYGGYGGNCYECGTSIASDRLYCDSCLGYGTCQDCGKSIASDRLYCDSCLYDY